jgi:hypothetical protein
MTHYTAIMEPLHGQLLLHKEERRKTQTSARLQTSQQMDQAQPKHIPLYPCSHRPTSRMHAIHKIQHLMGLQQHMDQTRQQMEGHILNTRRTIQTNGHVFRAHQLTRNIPDDDEHHILKGSPRRVVFDIHG